MSMPSLESLWMPFTPNRQFKAKPRILAKASGMHYWSGDGRQILDAVAGLWCVNAGHGRREITEAVARQLETMDYCPPFNMGHPGAYELANRVAALAPEGLDHVFFGNSGSEAVDTALKIAIGYHAVRGEARRTRIVGRVRGYNGVSFAGISVGGIAANRKMWSGTLLPNVDHLPHTHDLARNAFARGLPQHGVELANELEKIIALQDASTIAAVIVEPIAGSTGVLLPPVGYLQRLRDICTKHGILLIFDEVITGFGRTGSPFAAQEFGVTPDIITCAKGLTNGCVPMGARHRQQGHLRGLHERAGWHRDIPRLHLLGSSDRVCRGPGHPGHLCAGEPADPRQEPSRRNGKRPAHSLRGLPHVIDVRNYGLILGLEFDPIAGKPGARAFDVYVKCFERGLLVRQTADILALSPPLIIESKHIDQIFETLRAVIKAL